MSDSEKREVLDDLIQRRDDLQTKASRIQGRLDSARQDLETVEGDCAKKKIKPEELESTIVKLEAKFDEETTSLNERITKAEESITPFLED